MKNTLKHILTLIVDNPDEVNVEENEENEVLNLTISVATEDIGKVIGKNGKIIRAIRSAMKIPAVKQNKRIYITVADTATQA